MRDQLTKDMITAMKSGDKQLLSVIRMVKSQIQLDEIASKNESTDEEVITIISKQIKMRKDSIVEFEKAGRDDLVKQNQFEIDLLKRYLPEQLDEQTVTKIIEETILKVNATTTNDMGKLMKELIPLLKGKADMGLVNTIIKNKLN